jgi:Na+/H+-translocating membrane pyrophosphatase
LNALVRWIVWAVGFREAVDARCVLLAVLLLFVLLLEAPGLRFWLGTLPEVVALALAAGFFIWSVAAVEFCAHPARPAPAKGTVIATKAATATQLRNLPLTLITILLVFLVFQVFEPTYPL